MMSELPRLAVWLPTWATQKSGDWRHVVDAARAADASGVDRVVVSDHVVFGNNLDDFARPELGGLGGGRVPTGPDGYWLEPLTVLAAVSAVTRRVRLTTTVLLAALRRPVVLAKVTATLDVLSGGRLDLGVGVGWQREEYEAAGLDFSSRGMLLDQTLEVLQIMWRDNPASIESGGLDVHGIHMLPKPVQPGGVPVWVSGTPNKRVLNRIVRFGSGWIPWGPFLDHPERGIATVRQALSAGGRNPDRLAVLCTLATVWDSAGAVDIDATFARVGALADAGVTDFRVNLPLPDGIETATDYLATVVDRFRKSTGRTWPSGQN
jgi:probable F420-dependent oxidoreductase